MYIYALSLYFENNTERSMKQGPTNGDPLPPPPPAPRPSFHSRNDRQSS